MALENRLKEYRARLGINQADMGKLAGVSRQTISLIERGRLFTFSDAGFEAGEDLSGDSGRYFYLYGGWRR